jgi:hypothetical protein
VAGRCEGCAERSPALPIVTALKYDCALVAAQAGGGELLAAPFGTRSNTALRHREPREALSVSVIDHVRIADTHVVKARGREGVRGHEVASLRARSRGFGGLLAALLERREGPRIAVEDGTPPTREATCPAGRALPTHGAPQTIRTRRVLKAGRQLNCTARVTVVARIPGCARRRKSQRSVSVCRN